MRHRRSVHGTALLLTLLLAASTTPIGADQERSCGTTWEQEGWRYEGGPILIQPVEHGGYQDHVHGYDANTDITWFVRSFQNMLKHHEFVDGDYSSHTWFVFWDWHSACS